MSNYMYRIDPDNGGLINSITGERFGVCLEREEELMEHINTLEAKCREYFDMLVENGLIEKPVTVEDLQKQMLEMQRKSEEERQKMMKDNDELKSMLAQLISRGGDPVENSRPVQSSGAGSGSGKGRSAKASESGNRPEQ